MGKTRTGSSLRTTDEHYTDEEKILIVKFIADLTQAQLHEFMRQSGQPRSGTKEKLVERIREKLVEGALTYQQLVAYLDQVERWSAQHVFLFAEPALRNLDAFRIPEAFAAHLASHKASSRYRQPVQVALPETAAVSSIAHDGERITVTVVEKQDGWRRDKERDDEDLTADGEAVELRAYVNKITRGLMVFEWDLQENLAMLQVGQLPSHWTYEIAYEAFAGLVHTWLPLGNFPDLGLRQAIKTFHIEEETKGTKSRVRSHGIEYETKLSRRFQGRSATAKTSVLGEKALDAAMTAVRTGGLGRSGNFYYKLDGVDEEHAGKEVHVIVFAGAGRVNFPTANGEEVVRYVLARIREAC